MRNSNTANETPGLQSGGWLVMILRSSSRLVFALLSVAFLIGPVGAAESLIAAPSPVPTTTIAPANIVAPGDAVPGRYPNPGSQRTPTGGFFFDPQAKAASGPARTILGSQFPFSTCSTTGLPAPTLTVQAPNAPTLDAGSPRTKASAESGVLSSDGSVMFLLRFRACELQVETRYADYIRARGGPSNPRSQDQVDYDLQVAHAYCHAPRVTDNKDNMPAVLGTIEYPVAPDSKPFMSAADYNNGNLVREVQNQYPRLYELLSFCQNVATEAPQPNSKRILCSTGTPTAAFVTLIASLFSKNGLNTTLTASSVALTTLGSCGGGGGGGSNKGGGNSPGSGANSTAKTAKPGAGP